MKRGGSGGRRSGIDGDDCQARHVVVIAPGLLIRHLAGLIIMDVSPSLLSSV